VTIIDPMRQLEPLQATRLCPDGEAPFYVRGIAVCGGVMLLVGVLAWLLSDIFAREDKRRGTTKKEGLIDGDVRTEMMAHSTRRCLGARSRTPPQRHPAQHA